jgi:anti-sigma B factor antagonist
MQIREQSLDGHAVLDLSGDPLGENDAVTLKEKVYSLIDGGVKHVILNLQDVRHINSAGLGGMVCAMTALRRVGGDVYLASPQPNVTKILAITQLNRIIESYPSIADAVARVKR